MSIEKLSKILKESNNIVFFGGAGISTESGIPDFRSETGLYKTDSGDGYTPEVMLSHTFFMGHTRDFFKFYKDKMIYINAKPNSAHLALAKLEKIGKLKAVITQNIDGLHQAAGSKNVYELHGSVHRNYCTKCNTFYGLNFILESKDIPKCPKCDSIVKPDVILYEEGLDNHVLKESIKAITHADTLIIGGTSLAVYPAAGLINYFTGSSLILINKSSTPYDSKADLVIHESIGKVLNDALK
jgi:NAD-dependent deacetylase